MSTAYLDGQKLDLNPTSVRGGFDVRVSSTHTRGGKVVQVIGSGYTPLTVEGTVGSGGREAQKAFYNRILQINRDRISDPTLAPVRFYWPERGWDFSVYITSFSDANGGGAITMSNYNIAPKWRMTMLVVTDNDIKRIASDRFIARLKEGLGWSVNEYNGPAPLFGPGLGGGPRQEATRRIGGPQ